MAAVLGNLKIGMRKTGNTVHVPNNHKARLMFYLDCVCNVLNLENDSENLARLRNYSQYYVLTDNELDQLLVLCVLVSPDVLLNKAIFANDELCGEFQNQFYELSAVQTRLLVAESILIGGTRRQVQKIMTFKMVFLEQNYLAPMRFYRDRLVRIASGGPQVNQSEHQAITYNISGALHVTQPQRPANTNYSRDDDNSCECCTIL